MKLSAVHMAPAILLACLAAAYPCAAATAAPASQARFSKIRLLVEDGEKIKEREVIVLFESHRMIVRSSDTSRDLRVFAFGDIQSAQYSYSTNPRYKEGTGAKAVVNALTFPAFFLKGKKHWFSIKATGALGVLRLDKELYKDFIEEFENRTKVKVEDLGEEK